MRKLGLAVALAASVAVTGCTTYPDQYGYDPYGYNNGYYNNGYYGNGYNSGYGYDSGYSYGYQQTYYQPHYCHTVSFQVYDEYSCEYVYRTKEVCN